MTSVPATDTTITAEARSLEAIVAGDASSLGTAPEVIARLRTAALERARELGLPAHSDEEWRYTNPAPFYEPAYTLPTTGTDTPRELPGPDGLPVEAAAYLVFVDGVYSPEHSDIGSLPAGIEIAELGVGVEQHAEAVDRLVSRAVTAARDGLEALAAGLLTSGVIIRASRGAVLEFPIVLRYVTTGHAAPLLSAPHVVIEAAERAQIRVIEDHAGVESASGMHLGTTSIDAGAGAHVSHAFVTRDAETWNSFAALRIRQDRDSQVTSHRVLLGSGLLRNSVCATLEGEGGDTVLNGLFLPESRQHQDNFMHVEHMSPHCTSRQHYRGIGADRGRGVFTGRIYVHSEAQKTDAVQANDNLLLSKRAQITTKPQLEIYADDVKCTHGATTGQIDEDAMFYLRARGVPRQKAKLLLLHAFAGEEINRIEDAGLREAVRSIIDARLDEALARADGSPAG